jgi:undecaprenyl phosphate-alpha-L-ara4N flippase subunit ArnE
LNAHGIGIASCAEAGHPGKRDLERYRYGLLGGSILLGVLGQLLLKSGASTGSGIVAQFLSPWTIGGLFCYFLAALGYILALRSIPLSVAYPTVAVSYVVVLVASNLIWHEPLSWRSFAGIACIGLGIFLVHHA